LHYRVRCSCRKKTERIVGGKELRNGSSTSCGCIAAEKVAERNASGATKKRSERRYLSKVEMVDEEDKSWLLLTKCAKRLGIPEQRLRDWLVSCPLLDGDGIENRTFPDGLSTKAIYLLKSDFEDVEAALQKLPQVPEIAGRMYVGHLAAKLGISIRTLNDRMRAIGATSKPFKGLGRDGSLRERHYATNRTANRLLKKAGKAELPPDAPATRKDQDPDPPIHANGPIPSISPVPLVLSDRQRDVLKVMFKAVAFDIDQRMTAQEITDAVCGRGRGDPDSFKRPIAGLKHLRLIATKEGSGGGCWLTDAGRKLAETVRAYPQNRLLFARHP
jgi:hypothetical protein